MMLDVKASVRRSVHESLRMRGQSAYPGKGTMIPNLAITYLFEGRSPREPFDLADNSFDLDEHDQAQLAIVCAVVERLMASASTPVLRTGLAAIRSRIAPEILERYRDS